MDGFLDEKLDQELTIEYEQSVFGTWGTFKTPAGEVQFLETKARIGKMAKDKEKRLTNYLRPVREVLPTTNMDFNQLLQRDLDDHRVATGLVPYVLNQVNRPAFFPPIVAAILPFEGNDPLKSFPMGSDIKKYKDTIAYWKGERYDTAYKIERMQDSTTDSDSVVKLGRLSWNPEEAKFVVIDGQHRAMALLAIDRTINNTWGEKGEKYKYFYEPVIKELLRNKSEEERKQLFNQLEFAVTLVWFPAGESNLEPHAAARKLFVDVNQNARNPSESRILLLSDAELISIFTRRLLNDFREDTSTLQIYAIEYDHPGRDQASSSKWSVISNVIILRDCISRSVFGPDKYFINLNLGFGGRESEYEKSLFMQSTLAVDAEIEEVVEDIKRNEISNTKFPNSKIEFLQNQLMKGWGNLIVRMLSDLVPYHAHGQSLETFKNGWATAGTTDTLAKDAIFEGVGMFWTIRDSYQHWERTNQFRADLKLKPLDKTDIVSTWETLELKKKIFYELRCKTYLGKTDQTSIELSNGIFDVFSTNACQLGFVLAARTLGYRANISLSDMENFTSNVIQAANAGLLGGPKTFPGRKAIFYKGIDEPLNRIPKLDTQYAAHFRYFWLELLSTSEALDHLSLSIKSEITTESRDSARYFYYSYLVKEMLKGIEKTNTKNEGKAVLLGKAKSMAAETLRKSLLKWFGITKSVFEEWLGKMESASVDITDQGMEKENGNGGEETFQEEQNEGGLSFTELLDITVEKD
ncbi:ParB N-terminal domain-containing protein [Geomonas azotofigens]|uniref:DNA sulfur modification protein DndB n=1 Tax=Geomonas azotofigens TaxID=2843196 RepID=UPI001C0F521D|nr:DNA sulfur modification protein DndB [Geomonas azotofigens]MBU5612636.1 hypothetical protein [Geomonas azotofigens]